MSFTNDFEFFRNSKDFFIHDNWDFAIIMLADYFGINKHNPEFYLEKIARFHNKNFKIHPTKEELVKELTKHYESIYR